MEKLCSNEIRQILIKKQGHNHCIESDVFSVFSLVTCLRVLCLVCAEIDKFTIGGRSPAQLFTAHDLTNPSSGPRLPVSAGPSQSHIRVKQSGYQNCFRGQTLESIHTDTVVQMMIVYPGHLHLRRQSGLKSETLTEYLTRIGSPQLESDNEHESCFLRLSS